MQISPISVSTNIYTQKSKNPQKQKAFREHSVNINFNGKAGGIAGILVGGAAAVGLAIVCAPALICTGPLLGMLGCAAGDEIENGIRDKEND